MAVAAVGAALFAGQAVAATTALAAVAEVGTVLGVVGAVTGNKKLAQIGGVMGLVGGVGSLAASAFSSSAGAAAGAAAGEAANSASSVLSETGSWVAAEGGSSYASGMAADAAAQAAGNVGTGVANAQNIATQGTGYVLDAAEQVVQPTMGVAEAASAGANAASNAGLAGDVIGAANSFGSTPIDVADTIGRGVADAAANASSTASRVESLFQPAPLAQVQKPSQFLGGVFEKVGGWAEKNPVLAGAMLNAGGSIIKGIAGTPEDKYQERALALRERELGLTEERMRNQSVTAAAPVRPTGGPAPYGAAAVAQAQPPASNIQPVQPPVGAAAPWDEEQRRRAGIISSVRY